MDHAYINTGGDEQDELMTERQVTMPSRSGMDQAYAGCYITTDPPCQVEHAYTGCDEQDELIA